MLATRREFLKLILGTAPAVALSGSFAALWPDEAKSRPVADPITLFLDRDWAPGRALLVDDLDPDASAKEYFPPRREYFELETMSLNERCDFWREGWGSAAHCEEFLWDGPEVEEWTAEDLAKFNAFEAEQAAWLDEAVEIYEVSPRDLAFMTRLGPGIELFEALGPKRAKALGIYEAYFGGPASDGYGIAFRGDVEKLNAGLAASGINIVVRDPWEEDDEDGL